MLVILLIGSGLATVNQSSENPSMLISWILGILTAGLLHLVYEWGKLGRSSKLFASGVASVSEPRTQSHVGVVTVVEHTETVP